MAALSVRQPGMSEASNPTAVALPYLEILETFRWGSKSSDKAFIQTGDWYAPMGSVSQNRGSLADRRSARAAWELAHLRTKTLLE